MYDETNVPGPECRIRPVVRYLVTTYCHGYQTRDGSQGMTGSSRVVCECENEREAEDVQRALQHFHESTSRAMKNVQPTKQEASPEHQEET